jgi:prepilin-type processing-associated H-X9-DG protein
MNLKHPSRQTAAFTITELVVVVATLCLFAIMVFAEVEDPSNKAKRIACVYNLKLVGLSYRVWGGDNGDKYPAQVPVKDGGAMEPAREGNVAKIFQAMSNELNTPKILVCPADASRIPAESFTTNFDNSHVSYFAGLDANVAHPAWWLSGDSNISVDGKPVLSGIINLSSNSPVLWTQERHVNGGNLALADGSVLTPTSLGLKVLLTRSGAATNRLAVP